jgi:hypothetical protein
MEKRQKSMGSFPAILGSDKKRMIVCINRDDLKKIWSVLPKSEVKVHCEPLLVNMEEKVAVWLRPPYYNTEAEPDSEKDLFFVLNSSHLEECIQQENFFIWESGILCLVDESRATFPEENC